MVVLFFRLGVKVAFIASRLYRRISEIWISEDSDDVGDRDSGTMVGPGVRRFFFLGHRITGCDAMVLTEMHLKATREDGPMAR